MDKAAQLEEDVRAEWMEQHKELCQLKAADQDRLWSCLRNYMSRAFGRHGVQTMQLLSSSFPARAADRNSMMAHLSEAIREFYCDSPPDFVTDIINDFFENPTERRAKYVAQLLDSTFTFFALSAGQAIGDYLNKSISPLAIFLDTNFIFGILGLSSNPLVEVSQELLEVIKDKKRFPFTVYYHEATLSELERVIHGIGEHLKGRRWSAAISRVAAQSECLSKLEREYHQRNCTQLLDPDIFLSKFEHIREILKDLGFLEYPEEPPSEAYTRRKGELIAEYQEHIRPDRPKTYQAMNHDIAVWMAVQKVRGRRRSGSALDSGALFLTIDYGFQRFDWQTLKGDSPFGSTILPNHLLQLLRPFVPITDDFDRRFVESFAIPEYRAMDNEYSETCSKVLSFLYTFDDMKPQMAARILRDRLLMEQLRGKEEDTDEFRAVVTRALDRDLKAQLETAIAERADADNRATAVEHRQTALQGQLQETDERLQSSEQAHEDTKEKLDASLRRLQVLEDAAEQRAAAERVADARKLARRRQVLAVARSVAYPSVAFFGTWIIMAAPRLIDWRWLLAQPSLPAIKGCAVLAWLGGTWLVAQRQLKVALPIILAGVVAGALYTAISLLR